MPTRMGAFAEAAARFAGVDPADWPAVQAFFTKTLETLPALSTSTAYARS